MEKVYYTWWELWGWFWMLYVLMFFVMAGVSLLWVWLLDRFVVRWFE